MISTMCGTLLLHLLCHQTPPYNIWVIVTRGPFNITISDRAEATQSIQYLCAVKCLYIPFEAFIRRPTGIDTVTINVVLDSE